LRSWWGWGCVVVVGGGERAGGQTACRKRWKAEPTPKTKIQTQNQDRTQNIVYRDVKPDNFLFLSADEAAPLKATDFGLAIRHAPHEPKLTSRSGTPAYMAPELVMQCYDEKADLWSVGMLAYQLLTGRFPFWDDVREETLADVWKAVLSAPIDWGAPELEALSPSARDLLERLLQRNPVMRPSAAEALGGSSSCCCVTCLGGEKGNKRKKAPPFSLFFLGQRKEHSHTRPSPFLAHPPPPTKQQTNKHAEHEWLREGSGLAADAPLAGSVVQRLQRYATYAHLKQVVLRLITEQMRTAGRLPGVARSLRDLFARLDLDGNGELSVDELIAGLREEVRKKGRERDEEEERGERSVKGTDGRTSGRSVREGRTGDPTAGFASRESTASLLFSCLPLLSVAHETITQKKTRRSLAPPENPQTQKKSTPRKNKQTKNTTKQGYMVNEGEVRQLMSAIDLNRDGSLQDSEFLATMIDWPAVMREAGEGDGDGSEWASYVSAAFSRLDRDGDGFIDLDELLAELPPVYFSPASSGPSSVGSMGGASPGASPASSRDGGGGGLLPAGPPLEEAERERVAEAKRMLREADEDGDGRISREEFSNLLRHSIPDELTLYDSRLGSPSTSMADGGDTSDGAGGGGDPVARAEAAAAKAAAAAASAAFQEGAPSDARR